MAEGWIKLYRNIQEHWIWQDPQKLKWWLDILLLANHKDNKFLLGNELMQLERGEHHTSELKLSERWGVSKTTIRGFLKLLENDGMIELKKSKKGTTLKVSNYNDYQDFLEEEKTIKKPQKNHKETIEEPQKNHEVYTNNNEKNDNNDKNDNKYMQDTPNEAIEICKYITSLKPNENITQHLVQLQIWINDYGYEWTKEAIEKCLTNKNRFIQPYIDKILKDWMMNGKEEQHHGNSRQPIESEDREGIGLEL